MAGVIRVHVENPLKIGVYDAPPAQQSGTPPGEVAQNFGTHNFVLGQSYFPNGDLIELTSVDRSSDQIVTSGRYKLVSAETATLALNITSHEHATSVAAPEQSVHILNGEGSFELKLPHPYSGMPHIAMYDYRGGPFANVYFGTPQEAKASYQLRLGPESQRSSTSKPEPTLAGNGCGLWSKLFLLQEALDRGAARNGNQGAIQ